MPGKVASLAEAWTSAGIDEAVKLLLSEDNTLFSSLMGKLTNYPVLKDAIRAILFDGDGTPFLQYDEAQSQLRMYGFIKSENSSIAIANKVFEMLLYKHFIGEETSANDITQSGADDKPLFIKEDGLDVPLILERFIYTWNRIYGTDATEKFMEEEGRNRFLLYLSPIINGTGTYSVKPQTRDHRRMDVVIHYLGKEYVIELKIWRGDRYNEKGEQQISDYLNYFGLDVGYMLSFNSNEKKESGVKRVKVGDKTLYEGVI